MSDNPVEVISIEDRDADALVAEVALLSNTEKWDEPADGPQPPEPPKWRDDDGIVVTEFD